MAELESKPKNIISEESYQTSNCLGTPFFKLEDKDDVVLLFDALDELDPDLIPTFLNFINRLIEMFPLVSVFASCRTAYVLKWKEIISPLPFQYIEINRFRSKHVHQFLKKSGFDNSRIGEILEALDSTYSSHLNYTPRYLEMLLAIAKGKTKDELKSLKRRDLFESYISESLKKNLRIEKAGMTPLVRRVLEKLALVMEIYQSNKISKDEFFTFLDETDSNLGTVLLKNILVDDFFDKCLLKQTLDSLEFENAEFQEYLAAKECSRLSYKKQVVYDLVVNPKNHEFHPSWRNTLTFIIELDPMLSEDLLLYGLSVSSLPVEGLFFSVFKAADFHLVPPQNKSLIFDTIFQYYKSTKQWMDSQVSEYLSQTFSLEKLSIIEANMFPENITSAVSQTEKNVLEGNALQMLHRIFQKKALPRNELDRLETKIVSRLQQDDLNEVIYRHGIICLGAIGNIDVILKLRDKLFVSENTLIRSNFIYACQEANPNDTRSIDCALAALKDDNPACARECLYAVTNPDSLAYFLERISEDTDNLDAFVYHNEIHADDDLKIVENIESALDQKLKTALSKFILNIFSNREIAHKANRNFISPYFDLVKFFDPDIFVKIVRTIVDASNGNPNFFWTENHLSESIEPSDVPVFVETLLPLESGGEKAFWLLRQAKMRIAVGGDAVYEEGRKLLPEIYAEREKEIAAHNSETQSQKDTRNRNVYDEFVSNLSSGFIYSLDLFVKEEELISKTISKEVDDTLKKSLNALFENSDPRQHINRVKSTRNAKGELYERSYPSIFRDWFNGIKVYRNRGYSFRIDREKVISLLPFAWDSHLEALMGLLEKIQPSEANSIVDAYKDKEVRDFCPANISRMFKDYGITELSSLVKEIALDKTEEYYTRLTFLESLLYEAKDETYVLSIRDKIKREASQHSSMLLTEIDEHLIGTMKRKESILEAFGKIKANAVLIPRDKEMSWMSAAENHGKFLRGIERIDDERYWPEFEKALLDSFDLLSQSYDYWGYVQIIWNLAMGFIKNLATVHGYRHMEPSVSGQNVG